MTERATQQADDNMPLDAIQLGRYKIIALQYVPHTLSLPLVL